MGCQDEAMHETTLELTTTDGTQGVLAKHPDGPGPWPVVVMFPDGPGVREATHEVARMIAAQGYYVVAPDRYYRFGRFLHIDPAEMRIPDSDAVKQFRGWLMGTSEEQVGADLDALLAHLADDPDAAQGSMGVVGYCVGARSSILTATRLPEVFACSAGMHPSFCTTAGPDSPHLRVAAYPGEVYIGFGSADRLQSPEANAAYIDAVNAMPDGRGLAEIHDGADHGFAVPGPSHHQAAADRSYHRAFAMFARTLRAG